MTGPGNISPVECVGGVWYVHQHLLIGLCGISENTLDLGGRRNSPIWQGIEYPANRNYKLIRYDTMKPQYQALVRAVLCGGMEPHEYKAAQRADHVALRYTLTERLEQALEHGYRRYEGLYVLGDDRASRTTQKCLARAAAVIELLIEHGRLHQIGERSYQPYQEVIDWLNSNRNYDYYFPKGNQYLPLHPIKLKEKVLERTIGRKVGKLPREENPLPLTEVIKLPRQGNKNADEFSLDGELNAWVLMALRHARKDPKAECVRKVQFQCQLTGRNVPSASWFAQILSRPQYNLMAAAERHGTDSKHYTRFTHSITMARAMYAGDCWMIDATRVNFIEHACSEGDKKRFLVVIAIRDAYSGDIVGVHFDTKEDRWGYAQALKMAVTVTGYLPHTLVHDRFPGHLTGEMTQLLGAIERKGVHLVCTHKATGKGLLERWFDTLQTVFLTQSRYYYGQGIRSTREYAHRSPAYLSKLRKEAHADGFDFDQAWQEAWRCIEAYRQTPVSHYGAKIDLSPAQLRDQCETPNVVGVEIWEQASLFWLTKVLDIRRNAITHEVWGQARQYDILDKEILYRYQRVAVRYEEADASRIMLFAVDRADQPTEFLIGEVKLTPAITLYGPDGDQEALAKRQAVHKRLHEQIRADADAILEQAHQDPEYLLTMGGYAPKPDLEDAETAVLYRQMATAQPTPATVRRRGDPAPPPAPPSTAFSDY